MPFVRKNAVSDAAMKATKEAIVGVLAALEERAELNVAEWREREAGKVSDFVARANGLPGICAWPVADPAGMPFMRAHIRLSDHSPRIDAASLAAALKSGTPPIWVMDDKIDDGELVFELVQITKDEIDTILTRLSDLLT